MFRNPIVSIVVFLLERRAAAAGPHLGFGRRDAGRIEVDDAGAGRGERPVAGQPYGDRHRRQVVAEAGRRAVAVGRPAPSVPGPSATLYPLFCAGSPARPAR